MTEHPAVPWLTHKRRAWLYRILLAAAALAAVYGWLDESQAAAWAAFVAALIGTGTAVSYTSTRGDDPQ